jgi:hypothetical protein
MPPGLASIGARVVFAVAVFAVLVVAITSRPAKRLLDFDQSFYLTIAHDLDRHGVFSNGVFDDVDSTTSPPPSGMFFSPLYPWLVLGAMKLDSRFATAVECAIEANHKKRDLATCEIYARPMLILHAVFLTLGIIAIALTGEILLASARVFYLSGVLATAGAAAEAELFSNMMTESVWFSLYSVTMLAFVAALNSLRTRRFFLAGLLLGLLCLTRTSFLLLAPILLGIMFVHIRWFAREAPRPWFAHAAAFSVAFLILIVPWTARNYVSLGKLAVTEEYGSATLVERFAFNDMTAREFLLAFPYCVAKIGPAAVDRLFGAGAMSRFEWNQPGSFFEQGRARRVALVAAHGRLDPIIGDLTRAEMARNWWRHALTTVPLGWCGLFVSGLWSLFMLPLFAWACVAAVRQSKPLFLFYALPALLLVGLHAAVANHYSRYNLGLIGPFAVGGAWAITRTMSALPRGRAQQA